MQTPSIDSVVQTLLKELAKCVHTNAKLDRICDTCKDTTHDSSHLCCNRNQSLCESHGRMMSCSQKHMPSVHQELFPLLQKDSLLKPRFLSMNMFCDTRFVSQHYCENMISWKKYISVLLMSLNLRP